MGENNSTTLFLIYLTQEVIPAWNFALNAIPVSFSPLPRDNVNHSMQCLHYHGNSQSALGKAYNAKVGAALFGCNSSGYKMALL